MEDRAVVKTIEYRGITTKIYADEPGQQFYCELDGKEVCFGSFNTNFEEDLYYLIDDKLDTIYRFGNPYFGAVLSWFFNGHHCRDIKLTYRSRIIKVFLVEDETLVTQETLNKLIEESTEILSKIVKK